MIAQNKKDLNKEISEVTKYNIIPPIHPRLGGNFRQKRVRLYFGGYLGLISCFVGLQQKLFVTVVLSTITYTHVMILRMCFSKNLNFKCEVVIKKAAPMTSEGTVCKSAIVWSLTWKVLIWFNRCRDVCQFRDAPLVIETA